MNIKLITDAGDEPVSVEEAKRQVEYTASDKDTDLAAYITAARMQAEVYNGRRFTLQRWDLALDTWPGSPMTGISALPNPYFGFWPSDAYRLLASGPRPELNGIALPAPLVSVESVTWKDAAGAPHSLAENVDYIVDTWKEPGLICPAANANWPVAALWPSSAIHIQFTAGMVPSADAYASAHPTLAAVREVPRNIRQGILLLVTQWFENRVPFESIRFVAEIPYSVTSLFTSDKLWA